MSDRVAIIGGATSGRNHFPSPILPATTTLGGNINYPFFTDLEHFMLWFYRVKTWRFSITINSTDGLTPESHTISFDYRDSNYTDFDDATTAFLASREHEWAVLQKAGTGLSWSDESGTYVPDDESDNPNSVLVSAYDSDFDAASFAVDFAYGSPVWQGGQFLCEFGFEGDYNGQLISSHAAPDDSSDIGFFTLGATPLSNITGIRVSASTPLGASHITSLTASLTPVEFWPYALRNGDPVWDTATGAQINDPLDDYDADDTQETINENQGGTPRTLVIQRDPSPWVAV